MIFADLVACFESLGDNCEFGLVQRTAGIEPLGFLRFSFSRVDALVRGLDCQFADLGDAERIEIYTDPPPNRELMVRIRGYGFQYHTDRNIGEVEVEDLRAHQARAVAFLTRKLLEDLRTGEKIFIRKGEDSTRPDEIMPLFGSLRRHGPATLLWVVVADDAHPSGSVEVLRPGLLKGYIDRFAPYHDAHALSDAWVDVCYAAHTLWRDNAAPGTTSHSGADAARHALLPAGGLARALRERRSVAARPPAAPPPQVRYRCLTLDEFAAGAPVLPNARPRAERRPFLPAATVDVPPFGFARSLAIPSGAQDKVQQEARGFCMARPAIDVWLLRNALVHGTFGMISLDDAMLQETLMHLPLHRIPGAVAEDNGGLRLPDLPLSATLPAAYHLLACNQDNFYHWMADAMSRFDAAQFAAIGSAQEAPGSPALLVPTLDVFWKWETLNALVPDTITRVALAEGGRVFVQRLLFVPDLSGAGFTPHPGLLHVFDRIGAALGHDPAARPWRRIYVARTDSRNRVLANEPEVMALAARAGFTPVVLSTLSVGEQARLFAEASHILAPHGAGLTNIGYCRPGARLCELQMDGYVHWAFRRLAALRGLDYGCVVGDVLGPPGAWAHANTWHIDPDAIDAVLRDPAFVD